MRIALVSTCAVATPPVGYGGTELVVAQLADELIRRGQDVTVYATADSRCAGQLRALFPRPVWPPNDLAELRHTAFAWHDIGRRGFDVVHLHHAMGIPFARFVDVPCAGTLHHDRAAALVDHYRAYGEIAYVAISRRQAELAPELPFRRVIHHGLDPRRYPAGDGLGGYVAFLGRFAQEKGTHLAILAAVRAGVPLRLAGRAHSFDLDYYRGEIEPLLARHRRLVENVGELIHEPKAELLRHAQAMLFPIQWEEPFGLVMIEAMFAGTPVIAYPCGAVPEIVDEGVTGFIVRDVDEMAARLHDARALDRRRVRQRAIERFSAARMGAQYLELYQQLVDEWARRGRARPVSIPLERDVRPAGAGGRA